MREDLQDFCDWRLFHFFYKKTIRYCAEECHQVFCKGRLSGFLGDMTQRPSGLVLQEYHQENIIGEVARERWTHVDFSRRRPLGIRRKSFAEKTINLLRGKTIQSLGRNYEGWPPGILLQEYHHIFSSRERERGRDRDFCRKRPLGFLCEKTLRSSMGEDILQEKAIKISVRNPERRPSGQDYLVSWESL